MANVGSGTVGNTLIGNGNGSGPRYAAIGTSSGLTAHGVVLAEGNGAFAATSPGSLGQVLTSNGASSDPSFQNVGSLGAITTITGDSGGPESPTAGNFNILGTGSVTVVGSSSTETVQLTGLTDHNVLLGAGTATITNVPPDPISGIPLVSNGSSADPSFGTAVVQGGGTGQNSFPSHSILIGAFTSPIGSLSPGPSGTLVQSLGAFSDPAYTQSAYPSAAGTSGNVITSNGTDFISTSLPNTTLTNHSVALGTGTSSLSSVGPSATSGSVLQSAGSSSDPAFSTASYPSTATGTGTILRANGTNWLPTTSTYPDTNAVSTILYASSANVMSALPTVNRSSLSTNSTGVPTWLALTNGQLVIGSTAGSPAAANITSAGGTVSITNGSNSISLDVNGSSVGKTITGDSGGALSPTAGNWNIVGSGSTVTSGSVSTLTVALTGLTNHAVLVGAGTSTITKIAATANTGAVLQNNSGADPSYSTATYPSTTTINQILYSSSANTVSGLSTAINY